MVDKKLLFKYRMLEQGLTQRELADKINISYNTINTWIAGETPINITAYLKMLNELNISINEIIKEID